MALVTHQLQGSCATFSLRPLSWTKGVKLKNHVSVIHASGRVDRCFPVKRNIRLSLGACTHGPKMKLFKISSFKGSAQNDESGHRANGSKGSKNSVKVSYIPKESGETIIGSPKVHSVPVSYTTERIAGSAAINKLFKKWLSILSSPSSGQVGDEIIGDEPSSSEELPPTQSTIQPKKRGEILKAVWCHFLSLDATIKIPLLIFAPLYLAINMIYGAQVSKELMPLWIFGPPVAVLYVKMLQMLWALYVFSFKLTVKLIKNLPTYYSVTSSYIAQGKLKEDIRGRLFWPVIIMKNLDYKELSKKKMKEFEEWFMDKYLDFVESIWPYYCGAIRFLKRANLI
ncbi:embryo defective 2759 [Euphorbia peplus]|nr:embryo defective 2759 [Euphorbia peplus]